ncbi:MAG TPA: DUF4105 domain-containing protein [Polyangiales bacterium]|nr:DUF4105 domain-containing protein [Polyangiales bacterium]
MVASRRLGRRRVEGAAACAWLVLACVSVWTGGPARAHAQADPAESMQSRDPADRPPAPPPIRVSVVTFGTGNAVHQYFGHNALVIEGADVPEPTVFNYGMFTFGPDMLSQFLHGRLKFWLGLTELQRTVAQYAAANRDVRLSELNLTQNQARAVLSRLRHDARPENRVYLYDHYFDNCSTRVRDVLDGALHGQLRRAWSGRARFTLRQDTMRHTQNDPLTEWGMMLALNSSVDRPQTRWNQAFLPLELERLLQYTTYMDEDAARVPLVSKVRTLYRSDRPAPAASPETRWPFTLGCGTLAGLCTVLLGERARQRPKRWRTLLLVCMSVYGLVSGLVGTLLVYLALWSDHAVAHGNANILLWNPFNLLAGVLSAAELATDSSSTLGHFFQRAADAIWFVTCASSLTLLILELAPINFEQDVSLTASLLVPISVGIAIARSRSPDPQRMDSAAFVITQRT